MPACLCAILIAWTIQPVRANPTTVAGMQAIAEAGYYDPIPYVRSVTVNESIDALPANTIPHTVYLVFDQHVEGSDALHIGWTGWIDKDLGQIDKIMMATHESVEIIASAEIADPCEAKVRGVAGLQVASYEVNGECN